MEENKNKKTNDDIKNDNEQTEIKMPKKRISPMAESPFDKKPFTFDLIDEEKPKPASKPKSDKKTKTTSVSKTKKTSTKSTKKTTTKKTTKAKIDEKSITSTKIDPRTGTIKQKKPKKEEKPEVTKKEIKEVLKPVKPKVKKTSIKSKDVTIEPEPRDNKPKEIIRPTPKKPKQFNKEEKVLYKTLEEAFNTVANMTNVIEERTMDVKNVPDLTIGELHVIEMVNKNNNKPMTLIAKNMHVTVGSLTIGVNRLVQKGYLLRTRDEMDRRVILLSITQQGKKILKFHDKFHDDILGLVLDTIPLPQAAKVMSQFAYILELYFDPSIADEKNKKERR